MMNNKNTSNDLFQINDLFQVFEQTPQDSPFLSSLQDQHFVTDATGRIRHNIFVHENEIGCANSFEIAGPRKKLFWDCQTTRVAIVTCGGLAPGLNNVIQNVVTFLSERYNVHQIFGVPYGFQGFFYDPVTKEFLFKWHQLTPSIVQNIDAEGGSILGTSRGHSSAETIVNALELKNINMLFLIGGDGTLAAGYEIYKEIIRRRAKISIIGIPKTIDNDVPWVDKTFGFGSAVAKAVEALRCAQTEARSAYHGIGMVKLMGRHSGALTATASVAMNDIDFVIIPEVPLQLDGSHGFLNVLINKIQEKKYLTIAVAEGAGQHLFPQSLAEQDASGNVKLKDIGQYLKKAIEDEFKRRKIEFTLKYIDPSYMLRSQTTTAEDSVFCVNLSQNAVHAAMSGKTGCFIGYTHDRFTHVPMQAASARKKRIDINDPLWLSVLAATGQPKTWD